MRIPLGTNLSTDILNHNNTFFLASSDNPVSFADLTFSIPSKDRGVDFILINPSQSPVTLTFVAITQESTYHPFAQMGRDFTYLGYAFLVFTIVILGAFYLRPLLARHTPQGRTDSSVEDITRGR